MSITPRPFTKPCPFCGAEADPWQSGNNCRVVCSSCEAEGPLMTTEEAAVGRWNAAPRTPEAVRREHIAGLALQGMLAGLEELADIERLARIAVGLADALLAELAPRRKK